MLTGEAKKQYQRAYMRRKRAGEPTRKPKPEWQPTQRMIDEIERWARYPATRNALADRVLDGLTLDNDEAWMEACRRHKQFSEEQKRERQAEREKAEQPSVPCCWFCSEPKTTERLFFGDRWRMICEVCVDEVAAALARERAARSVTPPT